MKTRLEKVLPPEAVLDIYKNLAADVICSVQACIEEDAVLICFHPPGGRRQTVEWLGDRYCHLPQVGSELGERMKNSFRQAFQRGFSHAILLGTDLPDLPPEIIEEALSALKAGTPVIGPSADGGYYLIGFDRFNFNPAVFRPMPWGTAGVFARTIAEFRKSEPLPHILPEWQDIDAFSDLLDLIQRCSPPSNCAPHTMACLKRLGMV